MAYKSKLSLTDIRDIFKDGIISESNEVRSMCKIMENKLDNAKTADEAVTIIRFAFKDYEQHYKNTDVLNYIHYALAEIAIYKED